MRKTLVFLALILIACQTSCEKKVVVPLRPNWDEVKRIISERPDIFRLGIYDTEPDTLFYREITANDPDILYGNIHEANPSQLFDYYIDLQWSDIITGILHYHVNGKPYEKPFTTITLTDAYFEKWGSDSDPYRGWLLKKFSGTLMSAEGSTKQINGVDIKSEGVDTSLVAWQLLNPVSAKNILAFSEGEQVTFTIDVADTSDFFFLHVKEGETYQKSRFTNNGNGTLSAGWTTTTDPNTAQGYKHAIVDVVSRESVTDTLSDYESNAWAIIYKIK
jgi:hypothetical protein